MMSKHCFFKVMREDLRHKTWMLALSILGNMLAILVIYLMDMEDTGSAGTGSVYSIIAQIQELKSFFGGAAAVTGGIIAGTGALIVGLAGFRYVFHKNMVDTYHSIPVKRRTLFLANWLNGFLIWFVPCLVSMGLTLMLGTGKLSVLKNRLTGIAPDMAERHAVLTGGGLAAEALISLLTMAVVFLLVYHLVLLAVMLCGNVLNTLVTVATLGVGVISVYGLTFSFCALYLDTFFAEAVTSYRNVVYASPLASAVALLYWRCDYCGRGNGMLFWTALPINLAIALALGALALLIYLRRPSELAEQGMRNRPVKYTMQLLVSLGAAMGGWLLFSLITGAMGWGAFGALLAGVLAFGVMNVIFRMEFKAFFAHKALMAVTAAAGILIGLAFRYDWMGYDGYLPAREDIAEIAVYGFHGSRGSFDRSVEHGEHPLNRVSIRDRDAAYAFLESAVRPVSWTRTDMNYPSETIYTKVTLNNGRVYYRYYRVNHADREPAAVLLTTPEYLDANYRIEPAEKGTYDYVALRRLDGDLEVNMGTPEGVELLEAVCEAYNRDLEENPSAFLNGDGRLLCRIDCYSSDYNRNRYLDIWEGMRHTVRALRDLGYEQYVTPVQAEKVAKIRLGIATRYYYDGASDLTGRVRDCYGVWPAEESDGAYEAGGEVHEAGAEACVVDTVDSEVSMETVGLWVEDPEEIRELLELISYIGPRHAGNAFQPEYLEDVVLIEMTDGETVWAAIPRGVLPEKYILRFSDLGE